MSQQPSMRETQGKMFNLEKASIGVGLAVGVLSILSLYNSYVILPFRVEQLEKRAIVTEAQIQGLRDENRDIFENLIRIDERLKSVQIALKIKTEP